MNDNILELVDVSFTYPDGTWALRELSLGFKKGRKTVILGSNGAGKSTLFLHLNGIYKPVKGKVYFKGEEVRHHPAFLKELRQSVGIVFQDPDVQLFSANVYQEVSFGPMNLNLPKSEIIQRVDTALEAMGISHLKSKATHFLSYGQKRLVSIADILVMEPEVIILDEPTAGLDGKHAQQLLELLDELNGKGITLILSTHEVDTIFSWADHVIIMDGGRLLGEGTPAEIFFRQELIQRINLYPPIILEVYRELRKRSLIIADSPVPRSLKELLEIIEGR